MQIQNCTVSPLLSCRVSSCKTELLLVGPSCSMGKRWSSALNRSVHTNPSNQVSRWGLPRCCRPYATSVRNEFSAMADFISCHLSNLCDAVSSLEVSELHVWQVRAKLDNHAIVQATRRLNLSKAL